MNLKRSFSQRMGHKQVRSKFQLNTMDDVLRNRLWNALKIFFWNEIKDKLFYDSYSGDSGFLLSKNEKINLFYTMLWDRYFKRNLDSLSLDWEKNHQIVQEYFFSCAWNEVYDFIEFIVDYYPNKQQCLNFIIYCNVILEEEMSGFRFVDNKISPIIDKEEINEIEKALLQTPFEPIQMHLKTALEMFSDRKNPDYRNSIKESISAIEALCRHISGRDKATLGDALDNIKKKKPDFLHPSLKEAFDKIYGYTSDVGGIRHAILEMKHLKQEDARWMFIVCSAFVNYLMDKMKD